MKENIQLMRIALIAIIAFGALMWYSLGNFGENENNIKPNTTQKPDNTPTYSEAEPIQKPKPDTSAQKILLIGDSMMEGLQIYLKMRTEKCSHNIVSLAKTSTSIVAWVGKDSTGNLKQAIKKHQPTLVLISLGSNELFAKKALLPEYAKYLDNILLQLGNTNFVWICPPNWKKDFGLTDLILEKVQEDRFFPSRDLKLPRTADGIHPTMQGYEIWADKILHFILESPRKPIQLVCKEKAESKD